MKKNLAIFLMLTLINISFKNILPDYIYTDGNNNKYEVYKDRINYIPVTKENSSSGIYSGGEPKNITIDKNIYNQIQKLIKQTIKDKKYHLTSRIMGCGTISKNNKTIFISRESKSLNNLETYLKEISNH
jgi:hypothetical protein